MFFTCLKNKKQYYLSLFFFLLFSFAIGGHPITLQQAFYGTFSQNNISLRIDINFSGAPALVLRNYLKDRTTFQERKKLLASCINKLFYLTSEDTTFTEESSQLLFEENPTNYTPKSNLDPRDYPCNLIYKKTYKIDSWPQKFHLNFIFKLFKFNTLPLMNLFKKSQAILIFKLPFKNLKTDKGIIFSKTQNYHQIYDLTFTQETGELFVEGDLTPRFRSNQTGK